MAEYTPTAADVRDFVENLEAAARFDNPNLGEWWNIIISMHTSLVNSETRTIRPFTEFHGIRPHYQIFSAIAYEWLALNYKQGTIREALGRIGHTKPGLTTTVTQGMAAHEFSGDARKVRMQRADQSPSSTITSLAEFWAAEGALKRRSQRQPQPSSITDIPRTYEQMLPYVNEMKLALPDLSVMIDKPKRHQVAAIKATSGKLFEQIAWFLMFKSIDAQEGNPCVYPWSTSFYLRNYPSWFARWDDMLSFLRASKGAVCNLLICPHATRFASDPASELNRKKINKQTNDNKAIRKAATDAALAQVTAANINGGGIAPLDALANNDRPNDQNDNPLSDNSPSDNLQDSIPHNGRPINAASEAVPASQAVIHHSSAHAHAPAPRQGGFPQATFAGPAPALGLPQRPRTPCQSARNIAQTGIINNPRFLEVTEPAEDESSDETEDNADDESSDGSDDESDDEHDGDGRDESYELRNDPSSFDKQYGGSNEVSIDPNIFTNANCQRQRDILGQTMGAKDDIIGSFMGNGASHAPAPVAAAS